MTRTACRLSLLASLCAATALAAAALPVSAATMRPGLWETSSTLSSADPKTQAAMTQMQKSLASMTPTQRQQLQTMLQRNGVNADLGANGVVSTRMCITPEMIARQSWPVQQGQCTQQATALSSTHIKVAFNCTTPAVSGQGDVTIIDATHYVARVTGTAQNGQNVNAEANGTWLSADCGSVRPEAVPATRERASTR